MRWRILLPACNAAIDILLLVATVYAVNAYRSSLRHPWPLWSQRYARIDPDFLRNADGPAMPAPLQAVSLGTPPAAIAASLVAELLFANGARSWIASSPFDLRLVGLHLVLAAVFWYRIGRRLESDGPRWEKATRWYLIARLLTVPASLALRTDALWGILGLFLGLVWTIFAVLAVWNGLRRIWLHYRSPSV